MSNETSVFEPPDFFLCQIEAVCVFVSHFYLAQHLQKNAVMSRLSEYTTTPPNSQVSLTCSNWVGSFQSTPRAYGHFSLRDDAWVSTLGATHEINIGAGTLARPIEAICATLLHEMCHYYAHVHSIQDTSRGYTYHNKRFKQIAESHGLIVEHDPKYGWTITHPSEELLDFILENDLTDILITRNEHYGISVSGTGSHNGNLTPPPPKPSSSRKYVCPCCGNSVRATKCVHIACMDCQAEMVVAS